MENLVIPGRIQMERFIPVGIFRNRGNIFQGITSTFFALLPKWLKFFAPFVRLTSVRFPLEADGDWF